MNVINFTLAMVLSIIAVDVVADEQATSLLNGVNIANTSQKINGESTSGISIDISKQFKNNFFTRFSHTSFNQDESGKNEIKLQNIHLGYANELTDNREYYISVSRSAQSSEDWVDDIISMHLNFGINHYLNNGIVTNFGTSVGMSNPDNDEHDSMSTYSFNTGIHYLTDYNVALGLTASFITNNSDDKSSETITSVTLSYLF